MHDDDLQLKGYQDDLDTDPAKIDEITHEVTDEPFNRDYLERHPPLYMSDDEADSSDDVREFIEDEDEGDRDDRSS
jgi:hypothetical protein